MLVRWIYLINSKIYKNRARLSGGQPFPPHTYLLLVHRVSECEKSLGGLGFIWQNIAQETC